ncbi:MAG: CDP-alcohol phosphatidyltransferase family protein [Candidatus Magasanikbacteria bacterium]|nr:CDP-alcohol phosphatidyltransferase family protein [Candidatus Magasanikbacteria bacterium]
MHDKILNKTILWMIPHWVHPNAVTLLRLILIPFVVYVNYIGMYRIGMPLFLFAAFTDAVDGSLARTRGQITNFGKLFDPLADKLLIGSMIVLFMFRYLDHRLAYAVLSVELLFIILATARRVAGHVGQANLWGKLKMLFQCIAVCLILLGLAGGDLIYFAAASWIFGAAIVLAIVSLFFHGI